MSRVIQRFPVSPGPFTVDMPEGAKILSVGIHKDIHTTGDDVVAARIWGTDDYPVLYALVNPDAPKVEHRFVALPLEHPIMDEVDDFHFVLVGRFSMRHGRSIFHLFDAGEAS